MSLIDQLAEALTTVQDPELHRSITDLGMVEDLSEEKGDVTVKILLTISGGPMQDRLRNDVTKALFAIEGERRERHHQKMARDKRKIFRGAEQLVRAAAGSYHRPTSK